MTGETLFLDHSDQAFILFHVFFLLRTKTKFFLRFPSNSDFYLNNLCTLFSFLKHTSTVFPNKENIFFKTDSPNFSLYLVVMLLPCKAVSELTYRFQYLPNQNIGNY